MNPWFDVPKQGDRPGTTLFCFPHAGGGASSFRPWRKLLPQVEVVPACLPGREMRIQERPAESLRYIVDEVTAAIEGLGRERFAIFGHSFGAMIGCLATMRLAHFGRRQPVLLIVSGATPPHTPPRRPPIAHLPDDELITEIRRFQGSPDEALDNPDLMELLLPSLRADLVMSEGFGHRPLPAVPCPIVAFGGDEDPEVPVSDLEAWRTYTTKDFSTEVFPGGHFFIKTAEQEVLRRIGEHLSV